MRRSQEDAKGVEQVQDFSAGDGQLPRREPFQQGLMHFIYRLVPRQAQVSDQQHDVEPKGEPRQGQRVGCHTAVDLGARGALGVGAAIATVDGPHRASERDDHAMREGGEPA